jgi:hypothetical protein
MDESLLMVLQQFLDGTAREFGTFSHKSNYWEHRWQWRSFWYRGGQAQWQKPERQQQRRHHGEVGKWF